MSSQVGGRQSPARIYRYVYLLPNKTLLLNTQSICQNSHQCPLPLFMKIFSLDVVRPPSLEVATSGHDIITLASRVTRRHYILQLSHLINVTTCGLSRRRPRDRDCPSKHFLYWLQLSNGPQLFSSQQLEQHI